MKILEFQQNLVIFNNSEYYLKKSSVLRIFCNNIGNLLEKQ
ncbi:hypothetical protein HMPREF1514_0829 [Streptococcus sp. AS20]|uniref:Uncharacterized protein n=2 Tax=Streptococcus TaxID=1301 RepID=A0AAD2SW43_STRCV|nr:hypothetical protein HMPREF9682_00878 [Streptococcus intermedius F0395]EID20839.1 hypothetical protein HMPREF1044_1016 [Streptococcus constellatus subsp. constellatus SK53]EUB25264.1 hypothetical protein HMPREF1514_0829 [Streptococcus sp. AS20]SUN40259.1 Uncharacterised protein [Streptococcus constellatus]SUN79944.1 Uncharacterised protein [Streptococcus milleri]BBD22324.1 hypothetical protein SCSC_0645 [Streptococcus constellatus subsp. constellatus]